MKKLFVVGNWKCNPNTLAEAKRIFDSVSEKVKPRNGLETVICPPFVFIPFLKGENVKLGAQDCFYEEKGPFTGEVSVDMLKEFGCQYVIVGHSERRKWQGETDEMINKKVKATLAGGLKTILCIEKESQIGPDLKGTEYSENLMVAFEPVSAIGTGKPYDVGAAKDMCSLIRKKVKDVPVLYGGSVNAQNAEDYVKKAGFDGFLIGGVSLVPDEFVRINQILI